MIDVSSLDKALATLDVALSAYAASPQDPFIRDACIQRFGYCYALSHDILWRYLEATEPTSLEQLSVPSVIRLGFQRGLLVGSWDVWSKFKSAREQKNETYKESVADFVLSVLPAFAAEANFMRAEIERRGEDFYAACA